MLMVYWKNMIASHYLFPILKSTIKTWSFQVFKASMISWHDFMASMISWELFLAPPPVAYSSFFLLFPPPPLLLPSWFHWTWWFHTPKWHSSSWANKSRGPKCLLQVLLQVLMILWKIWFHALQCTQIHDQIRAVALTASFSFSLFSFFSFSL